MLAELKKEAMRIAEEMNLIFKEINEEKIGDQDVISISVNDSDGKIDLQTIRKFHKELIPYLEIKDILEVVSVEVISG